MTAYTCEWCGAEWASFTDAALRIHKQVCPNRPAEASP